MNLPAGITCRADAPCNIKGCYAQKGRYCYKRIQNAYSKNLRIYKADPKSYFAQISEVLDFTPYRFFRWHSSGDIVDMQYLHMMVRLAKKHKGTRFLCFTKKYELVNEYFNQQSKPRNLIIVLSNWGEWKCENPHNFPVAYIRFNEETDIPINAFQCIKFCEECCKSEMGCWFLKKGQAVAFDKH